MNLQVEIEPLNSRRLKGLAVETARNSKGVWIAGVLMSPVDSICLKFFHAIIHSLNVLNALAKKQSKVVSYLLD